MRAGVLLVLIFFLSVRAFSSTPEEFFESGRTAFNEGKYSLAIDFFKKALSLQKDKTLEEKTLYFLALSLYYNSLYRESINYFLNLLNQYPQTTYKEQATFLIAINYYRLKDYEAALSRLRKYVATYPSGKWVKEAKFTIAYSLMLMNQYTQSSSEWEKFINNYPDDDRTAEAFLRWGQSLFYDEKYEDSRKVLVGFSAKYKNHPLYDEAAFFLAKDYYFLSQPDKAIQLLTSIAEKRDFVYYEDVLYFTAMSYLKKEDFTAAIDYFLKLTNSVDYSSEVMLKLGIIYRGLRDYQNSIRFLEGLLKKKPSADISRKASLELATTHIEAGNINDALVILKELQKVEDELSPSIQKKLGEVYLLQKDYPLAIRSLSIVVNKYSEATIYRDALILRAGVYFENEKYEESLADVRKYLSLNLKDEERANALLLLGDILAAQGKYNEAIENYLKILGLKSTLPQEKVYQLIGFTYIRAENYKKARESYDKIIKTSTNSTYLAMAYYNLGIIEYNQKNYVEAKKNFEYVYKNFKDSEYSEDVALKIGWIYFKEEKFKQLIDYLETISLSEKKWEYYNLKGWGYFRLGDYGKAIKGFEDSLSFSQNSTSSNESMLAIAKSYYNINDFEKAFTYYERVYNLSVESKSTNELPSILADMAWCQIKMGNISWANRYYEELINSFPENPFTSEALFKLAEYYYNISDFKRSARYYSKIIELNQDKNLISLSYYWLGWCYWNMNDKPKSIELFEKYIQLFPDGEYVPDVLLRISTIYYEWNNLKLSRETLERLVKTYPSSYEAEKARLLLSEIELKDKSKGNEEEFYKLLLKETKTKEAKANVLLKLASYYKENNRIEEAINLYKEIVTLTTKEEAAIATVELAFYNIEKGNYNEALDQFTSVFYVYKFASLYPRALYGIVLSYVKLGKTETAKKYLKRLQDNYPSSEWTEKALEIFK
ncbi:MAG: tetratricopeptide repeat protein [Brevinematia bacterium]